MSNTKPSADHLAEIVQTTSMHGSVPLADRKAALQAYEKTRATMLFHAQKAITELHNCSSRATAENRHDDAHTLHSAAIELRDGLESMFTDRLI